jgi:beta-glucanase (GH16 family)
MSELLDYEVGLRLFNVTVQGVVILKSFDIVDNHDTEPRSTFNITIPNIIIDNNLLNIEFDEVRNFATIASFVVKRPTKLSSLYKLVWSDEFTSEKLDPLKWSIEEKEPGWVNDELQRYTKRKENVRIENERLIIESRRDFFNGSEFTSGKVLSRHKGSILFGRVEVRAKLPDGRGTWPAIWMMPDDDQHYGDGWPDSGEIDIMEHVGYNPEVVLGTTHTKDYYWAKKNQESGNVYVSGACCNFHTYAMEWDENQIRMYVDNTWYFTYKNMHNGWRSWPFNIPFHVIINIAVGGAWGGKQGIDKDSWPQRMEIDFVKLYQLERQVSKEDNDLEV